MELNLTVAAKTTLETLADAETVIPTREVPFFSNFILQLTSLTPSKEKPDFP